jgi:histone demethylase JARID1
MKSDKMFETKEQKLHRLQEGISFGDGDEFTPASYEIYAAEVSAKRKSAHYAFGNEDDSKRSTRRNLSRNEAMTVESLEQDYWRVVETQQYSMS